MQEKADIQESIADAKRMQDALRNQISKLIIQDRPPNEQATVLSEKMQLEGEILGLASVIADLCSKLSSLSVHNEAGPPRKAKSHAETYSEKASAEQGLEEALAAFEKIELSEEMPSNQVVTNESFNLHIINNHVEKKHGKVNNGVGAEDSFNLHIIKNHDSNKDGVVNETMNKTATEGSKTTESMGSFNLHVISNQHDKGKNDRLDIFHNVHMQPMRFLNTRLRALSVTFPKSRGI